MPSHHLERPKASAFDDRSDRGDTGFRIERRSVDLAIVGAVAVDEIELVDDESEVTITTFPLALYRDLQRTSHGYERDIERCQEA